MALDDPHRQPSALPGADGPRTGSAAVDVPPFPGDEALPCGRLLSRVREQVQDGAPPADPHIRSRVWARRSSASVVWAPSSSTSASRVQFRGVVSLQHSDAHSTFANTRPCWPAQATGIRRKVISPAPGARWDGRG